MTRYLTVQDYIDRFGDQEATRLTSETQPPARDDTKIERAIEDSEEEVDGYVARRYALPLATVPRVLKTWVAVLAREKLHKTRPTPEVQAAADRARSQLRETSTGVFKLLAADESAPEPTGDREAMTSGDPRRYTLADGLRGYQLDGGGCPEPRWRQ